jgi:hypothetical protein
LARRAALGAINADVVSGVARPWRVRRGCRTRLIFRLRKNVVSCGFIPPTHKDIAGAVGPWAKADTITTRGLERRIEPIGNHVNGIRRCLHRRIILCDLVRGCWGRACDEVLQMGERTTWTARFSVNCRRSTWTSRSAWRWQRRGDIFSWSGFSWRGDRGGAKLSARLLIIN